MTFWKKTPGGQQGQEGARKKPRVQEYGESLFIALALALIIRAFLVQAFSIPSGSMEPTLLIGDFLLVNKLSYGIRNPLTNKIWIPWGTPQRGDVVVFIYPLDADKDYIKRVIGLPGETVEIKDKKVFINGRLLETPQAVYRDELLTETKRDQYGPKRVPENHYFVMGDNRDQSADSRIWDHQDRGRDFVSLDAMRGKAFIIYFSFAGESRTGFFLSLLEGVKGFATTFSWDSQAFSPRWERIGKIIH